jgi:hypothetical protein
MNNIPDLFCPNEMRFVIVNTTASVEHIMPSERTLIGINRHWKNAQD